MTNLPPDTQNREVSADRRHHYSDKKARSEFWSNYGPVILTDHAKTAFGSHPCRGLSVIYKRIGYL